MFPPEIIPPEPDEDAGLASVRADLRRLEALVRGGDQTVRGSLVAMRARLIEMSDAIASIEELKRRVAALADGQVAGPVTAERDDSALTELLVAIAEERRLGEERAAEIQVSIEGIIARLQEPGTASGTVDPVAAITKVAEQIGEKLTRRTERALHKIEESIDAVRARIDEVEVRVRAQPDTDAIATAARAQVEAGLDELRHDIASLTEDLHAEVAAMGEASRREVAAGIAREMAPLYEAGQGLRARAADLSAAIQQTAAVHAVLEQIASIPEAVGTLSAHLDEVWTRVRATEQAVDDMRASLERLAATDARIEPILREMELRLRGAIEGRVSVAGLPESGLGFLGAFGDEVDDPDFTSRARSFVRRVRRRGRKDVSVSEPVAEQPLVEEAAIAVAAPQAATEPVSVHPARDNRRVTKPAAKAVKRPAVRSAKGSSSGSKGSKRSR